MKARLLVLLAITASRLAADGLPTAPYIYVRGTASREIEADSIKVSFTLSKTNPEIEAAKNQVEQQARDVFALIESLRIPRSDVVAFSVRMLPKTDYDRKMGENRFYGYEVTRDFTVVLRDLTQYGPLVERLLNAKVDSLNLYRDTQLRSSKEADLRIALIDEALKNARKDAEVTAAKLGMKVKSVFSISRIPPPQILGEIIPYESFDEGGRIGYAAAALENAPYTFGKMNVTEKVFVIFLIEPLPQ